MTNRLLRHFNFISFAEMNDASVHRIFTTILGAFFRWGRPRARRAQACAYMCVLPRTCAALVAHAPNRP